VKVRTSEIGGKGFAGLGIEGKIEEDFVDDQGKIVFFAESVEACEFFGLNVGASGVVGMDEDNGSGARGNGAFEGLEIDEPTVPSSDTSKQSWCSRHRVTVVELFAAHELFLETEVRRHLLKGRKLFQLPV